MAQLRSGAKLTRDQHHRPPRERPQEKPAYRRGCTGQPPTDHLAPLQYRYHFSFLHHRQLPRHGSGDEWLSCWPLDADSVPVDTAYFLLLARHRYTRAIVRTQNQSLATYNPLDYIFIHADYS